MFHQKLQLRNNALSHSIVLEYYVRNSTKFGNIAKNRLVLVTLLNIQTYSQNAKFILRTQLFIKMIDGDTIFVRTNNLIKILLLPLSITIRFTFDVHTIQWSTRKQFVIDIQKGSKYEYFNTDCGPN